MPYTIYVLYGEKDHKLYVGCTNNIKERLKRHNDGHVKATEHRRPLRLIHQEVYDDKAEAFSRERFLKSLWGGREKKKILKKYLESF